MPRPTAVKSDPAVAEEQAVEPVLNGANGAEPGARVHRQRNPEVGLKPLQKATPPPPSRRGGGGGRQVNPATLEMFEALKADSGEWYLVGTYSTQTPPMGAWDENDIVCQHHRREDGLYDRYAKHDPAEAQARREARAQRAAEKAKAEAQPTEG